METPGGSLKHYKWRKEEDRPRDQGDSQERVGEQVHGLPDMFRWEMDVGRALNVVRLLLDMSKYFNLLKFKKSDLMW